MSAVYNFNAGPAMLPPPVLEQVQAELRDYHGRGMSIMEIRLRPDSAYVHLTSNETIQGIQWPAFPDMGDRPLVADMSSDILSRPFDASRFALVYAGAQKNLGPSGVTAVLLRESWLRRANPAVPTMLRYATHVKHNSLYNTPPTFAVYLLGLVPEWVEAAGG